MNKKNFIIAVFSSLMLLPFLGNAQELQTPFEEVNTDSLGDVTDEFQEYFFEALKQKGIENYEKAITALQECEKLQPENPVVFFELGKNYNLLENYETAITNLQKANRLKPDQEWILVELMQAYNSNNNYEEAIIIAKNLTPINSKYYNNLADLYFKTQRYDELIVLLDQLDAELGIDEYRLGLRQQIYALTNDKSGQIKTIEDAIEANPEVESNYLNLILVYSEEGMENEAFEAAEKMQQTFPNSKVVHLALYKFYLDANNTDEALNSMKIVLAAEEINIESKFKVLNDFLIFVTENPSYENQLKEVTSIFSEKENSPEVYQKLGEYYLINNQEDQALSYFELGIDQDMDNFELLKNTLLLQLDLAKYEDALKLSKNAMEIFPAQPILFLVQGIAFNNQEKHTEAVEKLTFGLDYLIDDPEMEINFYEQLSIAYEAVGNSQKAAEFQEKMNDIKTSN